MSTSVTHSAYSKIDCLLLECVKFSTSFKFKIVKLAENCVNYWSARDMCVQLFWISIGKYHIWILEGCRDITSCITCLGNVTVWQTGIGFNRKMDYLSNDLQYFCWLTCTCIKAKLSLRVKMFSSNRKISLKVASRFFATMMI